MDRVHRILVYAGIGPEIALQLPVVGLFWDAPVGWRDAGPRPQTAPTPRVPAIADTIGCSQGARQNPFGVPLPPNIARGIVTPADAPCFMQSGGTR